MRRIFIAGHRFNQAKTRKIVGVNGNKPVWVVRGVISCDGKLGAFAGWGRTQKAAQEEFDSFLSNDCDCVYGSDWTRCPVHGLATRKQWTKEEEEEIDMLFDLNVP